MKIFEKEIELYKNSFETYQNDISNQSKKNTILYKCKLFIPRLEIANKRFLSSLIFSIIVVLVVAIIEIKYVLPAITILFAIPYFITHADSDLNSYDEYPFREIEEKIIHRNLYATIVWVVSIGSIMVGTMLTW